MKYAVVDIKGKQYKISKGDEILFEDISDEKDGLLFDRVLLYVDDDSVNVGSPYVKDIEVKAKILERLKGDKLDILVYRAKSNYRRRMGFRPSLCRVMIEDIVLTKQSFKKAPSQKKIKKAS